MSRLAKLVFLPILLLATAALFTSQAAPPFAADESSLSAGPGGIKLYPRWSKLFKPLAEIKEAEVLTVIGERGSWKQVRIESSGKEGWILCDVKKAPAERAQMKLPVAAAPATSGLVAKGWSAKIYAGKHGTDTDGIDGIMNRGLDCETYERFIEEGGLKK